MTSWPARIENVPTVLETICKQTVQPDKVVINLSESEFEGRVLPESVDKYIKGKKGKVLVNWISGTNTKVWKKIIPTFELFPNDAIICIDDDCLYPAEFIETLWNAHLSHPNNPITGINYVINGHLQHSGAASLDKLCYYGDIFKVLKQYPELYNRHSSDTFFQYMALRNRTPILFCGREIFHECKQFNRVQNWSDGKSTQYSMAMWNFLSNHLPLCR